MADLLHIADVNLRRFCSTRTSAGCRSRRSALLEAILRKLDDIERTQYS
jgi:hypothetical protein